MNDASSLRPAGSRRKPNRPDIRVTLWTPHPPQRDLFETDGRLPMVRCPVCQGKKTVPFWSRQGKRPVIGGKPVRCETCHGTGAVPALG
jgi:hypothetical protein